MQIVRRQNKGMDVYMCEVGDQEMKLQLRALDESLAESSRLSKLIELAAIEPGEFLTFVSSLAHSSTHSPFHPPIHSLARCYSQSGCRYVRQQGKGMCSNVSCKCMLLCSEHRESLLYLLGYYTVLLGGPFNNRLGCRLSILYREKQRTCCASLCNSDNP